ncbi:hypothetical protein Dred_0994 [Desulforamulus reducens MI-1]|uniref:Uncharacterized protein n=1 Tax=Desulforamulus reducens (strain ATCC BAA-1160 / DSM 100696 / MI-1) TaxID=349161 RepID=A4J376_DESRM|nr:hypothetical protein [Desulforamulus reducens]ABO49529.1 hypothetical protein Dred_0994 [Desulforamulus reducens MI-1]
MEQIKLYKLYNKELGEVLRTRNIDQLIEFCNKWATKIELQYLAELKNQPRDFAELVMHQMILAKKDMPEEIKQESEEWIKKYRLAKYGSTNPLTELAREMTLVAKENPIIEDTFEMPHSRHWVDLPSGLRLCFTLKRLPDEIPFWHLSMSKEQGGILQEEIDNCVDAFFDKEREIDHQSGTINNGVLHFFQDAE